MKTGKLLCVFAHPDDDLTVAPLLSMWSRAGRAARIAYATSGQSYARPEAGLAPGDEVCRVREEEARRASRAYGIPEPLFLREYDGRLSEEDSRARLRELLARTFEDEQPETVISFGPEGFTGHADHVTLGAVTDALVKSMAAGPDLFHVSFPASLYDALPQSLRFFVPVDDATMTDTIDVCDGLACVEEAVEAYPSQFIAEKRRDIVDMWHNLLTGRVFLRRAA